MPRFIDRNSVKQVDLGPCECPTKGVHATDSVWLREQLSYADHLFLADMMAQGSTEALWALFNLRVARWNLVDEKGKPVSLSRSNWQNLDEATARQIQDAIGELAVDAELPNASSVPSASS
jgi:hypothetical protein